MTDVPLRLLPTQPRAHPSFPHSHTCCHTSAKKFLAAIQQKDQNLAQEAYRALQSELDNAKRKGVLKGNTCSRKKSRMANLFNKTFAAKTAAN